MASSKQYQASVVTTLEDALARLAKFEPIVLASAGVHPEAQESFLGMHPIRRIRLQPDGVYEQSNEAWHRIGTGLAALQACFDETRRDLPTGTGGWIGLVCYEALQHMEPTLPSHDLPYAQAEFVLVTDMLRIGTTSQITATDLQPGDGEKRLAAYLEALRTPATLPPQPPIQPVWQPSLQRADFVAATSQLIAKIHAGDLFQANLATQFSTQGTLHPYTLLANLLANPSPFMAVWPGTPTVVSGSPELLFATEAGTIRTRPIAGTRKRHLETAADDAMASELFQDPKERAEHTMLVDLLRNDVAKVSLPGTVHVPEFMSIERYRNVMHLVSRVEGTLRPDATVMDCLQATFPGGTITGAPKHRACMRIHEAEPVARGPYTGSMGIIHWNHDAAFNILIRSIVLHNGIHIHAGSGIVANSQPEREWLEANAKASSFQEAVAGSMGGVPHRMGEVSPTQAWRPRTLPHRGGRVLLIDNYDSFTYNIRDLLQAAGAQVEVRRNDEPWSDLAHWATHAVLSPGPGGPADSGTTLDVIAHWPHDKPLLGICLGHQAMAMAAGGHISNVPPVHGETSPITTQHPFLPANPEVARYHSLAATLPPEYDAIAHWNDVLMAMLHRTRPWLGLQFHPESIATKDGGEILARFLALP